MPLNYDFPTTRKYNDVITTRNTETVGADPRSKFPGMLSNWDKFFGGAQNDPYFNMWDRSNMAKTPEGRRMLQLMNPQKSWTEQLMDSIAQNQHYGGGPAKTVRQQAQEADLVKRGFSKMPNPATLDPNDPRIKFSQSYGYGSGGDIINMWDPRSMWVPGIAGGSLSGPPIRQY